MHFYLSRSTALNHQNYSMMSKKWSQHPSCVKYFWKKKRGRVHWLTLAGVLEGARGRPCDTGDSKSCAGPGWQRKSHQFYFWTTYEQKNKSPLTTNGKQWAGKLSQIFPPTSHNAHPAYAKASEYAVYSSKRKKAFKRRAHCLQCVECVSGV